MSTITNYVRELVRAANGLEKVRDHERKRLLERAVVTIRDLRNEINRWPGTHVIDAVDGLKGTVALIEQGEAADEVVKASLLDAADMIRDLLVVREAGTELS